MPCSPRSFARLSQAVLVSEPLAGLARAAEDPGVAAGCWLWWLCSVPLHAGMVTPLLLPMPVLAAPAPLLMLMLRSPVVQLDAITMPPGEEELPLSICPIAFTFGTRESQPS